MSLQGLFPLTPAYGRDYTSKAKVLADWLADKDFRAANGTYFNKQDADSMDVYDVTVRYNQIRNVCVLVRRGDTWAVR